MNAIYISPKPPQPRRLAITAYAMVVALLAAGRTADAEIKVGKPLPELSLKTAGGQPFELRRQQDRVEVVHGGERHQPKALIVHFFQPDCPQCQAQMQALQQAHEQAAGTDVLTVGIAHRGDEKAVRALAERLKITFPLAVGTGSDAIKALAAGDTMAIADGKGVIRFAQVGYGRGDERCGARTWRCWWRTNRSRRRRSNGGD